MSHVHVQQPGQVSMRLSAMTPPSSPAATPVLSGHCLGKSMELAKAMKELVPLTVRLADLLLLVYVKCARQLYSAVDC